LLLTVDWMWARCAGQKKAAKAHSLPDTRVATATPTAWATTRSYGLHETDHVYTVSCTSTHAMATLEDFASWL